MFKRSIIILITIKNIIKTLLEEGLTDKTLFNFNKTKKQSPY